MKPISWACALVLVGGAIAPLRAAPEQTARPSSATAAKARPKNARKPAAAAPAAAAVSPFTEALQDTSWRVTCEVCDRRDFSPYFMFLRADGQVGSNPGAPAAYNFVSYPGRWSVHGEELFIEWAHGEKQVYALGSLAQRLLTGVNEANQAQYMTQVVTSAAP